MKKNQKFYSSPEVEITEMSNQKVLCESYASGGTEEYQDGDTSQWY